MRKPNLTKLRKHNRKCHEKTIMKRKTSLLITVNETVNMKRRKIHLGFVGAVESVM